MYACGSRYLTNDQPFYSRRIGRVPQGAVPDSAVHFDSPETSTILGAVTGDQRVAREAQLLAEPVGDRQLESRTTLRRRARTLHRATANRREGRAR